MASRRCKAPTPRNSPRAANLNVAQARVQACNAAGFAGFLRHHVTPPPSARPARRRLFGRGRTQEDECPVHRGRRPSTRGPRLRQQPGADAQPRPYRRPRDDVRARLLPAGGLQPVAFLADDRTAPRRHPRVGPRDPFPGGPAQRRDRRPALQEQRVLHPGHGQDLPWRLRRRSQLVRTVGHAESPDLRLGAGPETAGRPGEHEQEGEDQRARHRGGRRRG